MEIRFTHKGGGNSPFISQVYQEELNQSTSKDKNVAAPWNWKCLLACCFKLVVAKGLYHSPIFVDPTCALSPSGRLRVAAGSGELEEEPLTTV